MADTTLWKTTDASGSAPRGLTVNGEPFFARGVCYSPVPWGGSPNWVPYGDFMAPPWSDIWERDLAAMRPLGINCLRTYNIRDQADDGSATNHELFFEDCWHGGEEPIFVLIGYGDLNTLSCYVPWNGAAAVKARETARANFLRMAEAYGHYPAVMGFILCNEVNSADTVKNPEFWQWLNALAADVKKVAPGKLTTVSLVDDSMASVKAGDQHLPDLDLWGINSYRGAITRPEENNFDILWQSYAQASAKPLLLSEWGAPASTHGDNDTLVFTGEIVGKLNAYVAGHYADIAFNAATTTSNGGSANLNAARWAPVCVGSCYFEWTDEWWKADDSWQGVKCGPNVQQPGRARNGAFPGGWGDEECFGLNAIRPSGTDPLPRDRPGQRPGDCPGPWNFALNQPYPPDELLPRESLATLSGLWKA